MRKEGFPKGGMQNPTTRTRGSLWPFKGHSSRGRALGRPTMHCSVSLGELRPKAEAGIFCRCAVGFPKRLRGRNCETTTPSSRANPPSTSLPAITLGRSSRLRSSDAHRRGLRPSSLSSISFRPTGSFREKTKSFRPSTLSRKQLPRYGRSKTLGFAVNARPSQLRVSLSGLDPGNPDRLRITLPQPLAGGFNLPRCGRPGSIQ